MIQGSDSDAVNLFDAINVLPVEQSGVQKKHVELGTSSAEPVFDLTCNKSVLSGVASCTLKVFPALAVINKNQKSFLMGINDRFDAPAIAQKFLHAGGNSHQGEVFWSINSKLRIWKTFDGTGRVVSFTVTYQE